MKKSKLFSIFGLGLTMMAAAPAFAQEAEQVLAFPGAEGFGKYASGGRGGKVFHVTNLDDDGEGSLRWALRRNGPKTIVFDVSGTIYLESTLNISKDSITIAGQTAPGEGITIAGYPVKMKRANNVIMRYLRFRLGDMNKVEDDALSVTDCKNVIIDHITASWSTDECVSTYRNEDFTLQWSLISESLYKSSHEKGAHGYGGIWGGKNASFLYNLLAHHDSRNPRFDHPGVSKLSGVVDFRNNVVYNWGNNLSYGGETRTINLVNNYYKPGPALKKNKNRYFFNPMNQTSKNKDPQGYGWYFVDGNVMEGNPIINVDNRSGVRPQNEVDLSTILTADPFEIIPTMTMTAEEAYNLVIENAGASHVKDAVDKRVLKEVKTGTARYGRTYEGGRKGIIDSPKDVGGYPKLKSATAPVDTDGDGIPDEWEVKNGLNPNDKNDGNAHTLHPQYTNLEVYMNSIVEKKK